MRQCRIIEVENPNFQYANGAAVQLEEVIMRNLMEMSAWHDEIREASRICENLQNQLDSAREAIKGIGSVAGQLKREMIFPLVDYIDECESYYESLSFPHMKPYIPLSRYSDSMETNVRRNEDLPCWVYFVESETTHFVKIGITINLDRRLRSLESASGDKFIINKTLKCSSICNARSIEGFLHKKFSVYRHHPNGRTTEWFDNTITPQVIALFNMDENELWRLADL